MNNLENTVELTQDELNSTFGGELTVNQERVIVTALFGLFGLAIYEISRNQCGCS